MVRWQLDRELSSVGLIYSRGALELPNGLAAQREAEITGECGALVFLHR